MRLIPTLLSAAVLLSSLLATPALAETTPDTTPPPLEIVIPSVSNVPVFDIFGKTEPGTDLRVNGIKIPVTKDGLFSATLDIQARPEVTVTATDAAGNKAEHRSTISFSNRVPAYSHTPVLGIAGQAEPGTIVTDFEEPTRNPIKADATGHYRLLWDNLTLGKNERWLLFVPPAGKPYLHYYQVTEWFQIWLPDRTNVAEVTYKGRTAPGWELTLNEKNIPVAADGSFAITPAVTLGDNPLQFAARNPQNGAWQKGTWNLRVLDLAKPVVENGMYTFTLNDWPEGTLLLLLGTNRRVMIDQTGGAKWPLPVAPGANHYDIFYFKPSGETGLFRYRHDYLTFSRQVRMNLGKTRSTVNGKEYVAPVAPQRIDGSTYVPLRFLGDALGADIGWDAETQTATFTLGNRVVRVTIDSTAATVGGESRTLAVPPRLVEGRTLVPLRFISESLGAQVEWDEATEGITISLP
ncbi:MAG TPA: stalk domain-containing protein [Symbiobacteriaceae bacterium]|nr:stalk domain-containing protein [Symbiobacteriaceae bacterium]